MARKALTWDELDETLYEIERHLTLLIKDGTSETFLISGITHFIREGCAKEAAKKAKRCQRKRAALHVITGGKDDTGPI
jgi:hypothetical protein